MNRTTKVGAVIEIPTLFDRPLAYALCLSLKIHWVPAGRASNIRYQIKTQWSPSSASKESIARIPLKFSPSNQGPQASEGDEPGGTNGYGRCHEGEHRSSGDAGSSRDMYS
jgi:hypothetical protein